MAGRKSITVPGWPLIALFLWIVTGLVFVDPVYGEQWRGLTVAPEDRCSPYNRMRDYRYPQSVEQEIVRRLGAIYSPYTGTCFRSTRETDIEHIIAMSEAHDSGLCRRSRAVRSRFARDIRNLTLASPHLNRNVKVAKDAAQWMPARNRCWFAGKVVEVRRAYGLTIDRKEAMALERILSNCSRTALEPVTCGIRAELRKGIDSLRRLVGVRKGREWSSSDGTLRSGRRATPGQSALELYDDNQNGVITCREARRHGTAPVSQSHPAYAYMIDGDGDGKVCE